jgi:hypothetical protein
VASAALPPTDSQATDTYPHITTLEKAILGQTYLGQALPVRLARMEAKAYGKASTDTDLSQRTDNLEDYSQKTLHQRPFGAGSAAETDETDGGGGNRGGGGGGGGNGGGGGGYQTGLSPAGRSAGDYSGAVNDSSAGGNAGGGTDGTELQPLQTDYPHINSLEKEILGQTFPGQPLPDRLGRMETKAFGKPSTIDDYSERTDSLEAYAQKKLHAKPFVQEQKQEAVAMGGGPGQSAGTSSGQSKLLNFVGNSLLSMAGVGRMGMPMMGGNPAFGNGMGGGLIPGFGGVRVRPNTANGQQAAEQPVVSHPEDPSVNDAVPPPAEAKLLTKVGWCEVQTFGHTFPGLHLPARLQQLNKELNYAPNKTALELMDDVGGLIKSVQARKKTGSAATSASPPSQAGATQTKTQPASTLASKTPAASMPPAKTPPASITSAKTAPPQAAPGH